MRKDEGLSSDVERLSQLSWMMFLKCIDDHEKNLEGKHYQPIIPKPYRWRDWAERGKIDDSELIEFLKTDLFPKLATLDKNPDNIQQKHVADIFKGFSNSVQSPKILRQIIEQINKVDFVATDDIHTLARMYEDMLLEMRNASGQNGEFYTPRPVIRFIVNMVKPCLKKGEKVLDPACGTGGFLTESLEFMLNEAKTPSAKQKLYSETVHGYEKKPLPYLLGMMNLMLHGIEDPNLTRKNTLGSSITELSAKDKFDVIVTNPPFGGEEESLIAKNLPIGFQTTDTALAFLYYIMEALKKNGRCGIILPNGPLFANGIAGKIKEKLLQEFNLHTIIRLPDSVFAPYTGIATNILFFDNTGPTKEIWYYQMKKRQGLKAYSKTKPIQYEDFADVLKWSENKKKNQNAWKVSVKEIKDYNLDIKNPNDKEETLELAPHELIENILKDEEKTLELLREVKELIKREIPQ
jgi:type I restriction enzyme M protein